MRCLYIDTSSSFLYAAIAEDDKLLAEVKKDLGQNLSKDALPEIVKLFEDSSLKPQDINKIIVVNGPGSFTGIRVGITIAKVYAWSLNIDITTITSLEAMATSIATDKNIIAMIDARRSYVYTAIYDKNGHSLYPPCHILLDEFLQQINTNDYIVITNDELAVNSEKKSYSPDMLKIINRYKNKEKISPHIVNPEYLKLTEAEEKNG